MHYLNEQVELEHTETLEQVFPLLESVAAIFPNWVTMICPYHHSGARFISSNCKNLFGYDAKYMMEHIKLEEFYNMIHPDDGEDLHACFTYFNTLLHEQAAEDHDKIRVIFRYRIVKKGGEQIAIEDEKGILKLPQNKKVYYNTFRESNEAGLFTGVRVTIYKQAGGLVKIGDFRPADKNRLSKREQDIVSLIRNGLTNKQIANKLNISQYTSRNIRSKLFERFRVNNVVELLNVAI